MVLVEWGSALDRRGVTYTYETDVFEHFSRHRPVLPLDASKPAFGPGSKISYTASIEGAVQLERGVVIGRQSTLRADMSPIRIGENTIIGDNVSLHTLELNKLVPGSIDIGSNVYIGDKATLRCCIIDDGAYIGEGSFIAEGAIVQRGAIVLPGTTVQPGAILTAGKVWGGNPCREIADLSAKYTTKAGEKVRSVREFIESVDSSVLYIQTPEAAKEEASEEKQSEREQKEESN